MSQKMLYNDLVSICIPTYNGEKYLADSINSAIKQSYKNIEIIISDDGSTDRTIEIINSFVKTSSKPIRFHQNTKSTIGGNWNNCVKNAYGNYIKFLFQDDLLNTNCIEKLIAPFLHNVNVGFSFSTRKLIVEKETCDLDETKEWISKFDSLHKYFEKPLDSINKGLDLLKDPNLLMSPLNKIGEPSCVLVKKSILLKAGGFNEKLKQMLDHEAWYRVFKYCDVGFIDEPLCHFRIHDNQATKVNARNNLNEDKIYRYLLKKNLYNYLHPNIQKNLNSEFSFYNKLKNKLRVIIHPKNDSTFSNDYSSQL